MNISDYLNSLNPNENSESISDYFQGITQLNNKVSNMEDRLSRMRGNLDTVIKSISKLDEILNVIVNKQTKGQ